MASAVETIALFFGGGGVGAFGVAWLESRSGRTLQLAERRLEAAANFSAALKRGRLAFELAKEHLEAARVTSYEAAEPLTLVEFLFGPDSRTAQQADFAYSVGFGGLARALETFLDRRDQAREPPRVLVEDLDQEWLTALTQMRKLQDEFNRVAREKIWSGLRESREKGLARW